MSEKISLDSSEVKELFFSGPSGTQTRDLRFRKPSLCSSELKDLISFWHVYAISLFQSLSYLCA